MVANYCWVNMYELSEGAIPCGPSLPEIREPELLDHKEILTELLNTLGLVHILAILECEAFLDKGIGKDRTESERARERLNGLPSRYLSFFS